MIGRPFNDRPGARPLMTESGPCRNTADPSLQSSHHSKLLRYIHCFVNNCEIAQFGLFDAVSTNNSELISLLSQTRELFNRTVARLLTAAVRCLSPTSSLTNKMLDPKKLCFYLY